MSFRVKTTHKLLDPGVPPVQNTQNSFMSLLKKDDARNSFLDDDFIEPTSVPRERVQENRPKTSSNQGMAIRSIPTAQADHM